MKKNGRHQLPPTHEKRSYHCLLLLETANLRRLSCACVYSCTATIPNNLNNSNILLLSNISLTVTQTGSMTSGAIHVTWWLLSAVFFVFRFDHQTSDIDWPENAEESKSPRPPTKRTKRQNRKPAKMLYGDRGLTPWLTDLYHLN